MRIPYPKPAQLSDPYWDWGDEKEKLAAIVAADPATLGREDFWVIFYQNLPAANYEEGCFYVPFFLKFYPTSSEFDSPNLEGFFWFVHHFREPFQRDGLLDEILSQLWEIFQGLVASFQIRRFSDDEMQAHRKIHRETVPRSQIVGEMLDCFAKWETFDPILEKLRAYFSEVAGPERSFWFCECAYHLRQYLWLETSPVIAAFADEWRRTLVRRQELFDFFHRLDRFGAHYKNSKLNMDCKINEGFFEYNKRIAPQ
jgi:hypothetical protein